MEMMRWTEITTPSSSSSSSSTNGRGGDGTNNNANNITNNGNNMIIVNNTDNNNNNNHHHHHHHNSNNNPGAPTIKNHSVTYFSNYLYCFGGYDGRRNHMTLLLYSIKEQRWIRPHYVYYGSNNNINQHHSNNNNINNNATDGAGAETQEEMAVDVNVEEETQVDPTVQANRIQGFIRGENGAGSSTGARVVPVPPTRHTIVDRMEIVQEEPGQQQQQLQQHIEAAHNNVAAPVQPPRPQEELHHERPRRYVPPYQHDYVAGDRSVLVSGNPPPGRNGHSATLATDPQDEDSGQIIIIGGWLGTGPLAASDMHVLDISNGGQTLRWHQPVAKGTPPGPCNMHSADYVPNRREVYVFRGGNGREYLNDLHALNVKTMTWRKVETTGQIPQQRANHSSAFLEKTIELFIFGGWNGTERLNDIHILDTETSNWTCPRAGGTLPHPRAGMTLTALRGRLYLFGGSGTSSKCFQDLQILDRDEMAWLDVSQFEAVAHPRGNGYVNSSFGEWPLPLRNTHDLIDHPPGQDGMHDPAQFNFGGHDGSGPQSGVGDVDGHHRARAFTSSRADWRSREMAALPRSGTLVASPNPNDEDTVPRVLIRGRGPGRRAGHTATAVNRKIYVFGGSCGADYLNDFFILDTDPPPKATVNEPTSLRLMERRMGHFFNDEEFSDVTFIVQGRKVYGHKMVLAIVSDCFRAMFTAGFRESSSSEIEITDCSYEAFLSVMEYIYTGIHPNVASTPTASSISPSGSNTDDNTNNNNNVVGPDKLGRMVEILELADRFFLDHLKQVCETQLQHFVNDDSVEYLLQIAHKTDAVQLLAICEHLLRNRDTA